MSGEAELENSEEKTEAAIELVVDIENSIEASVSSCEGDTLPSTIRISHVQHDKYFIVLEHARDYRTSLASDLDEVVAGSLDDISDLEIDRLHQNSHFVDFRKMPIPILQCFFWPDRWKILCVCIFLNCTRRVQVEKVVWKFFERYPTPEVLLSSSEEEIQEIIKPLGFYKRRTTSLRRMSEDFVSGNWKSPEDLRSVGVYAATCYRMMFLFELGDHAPDDHALVDLYNWMKGMAPRRKNVKEPGRCLPDVRR